ncbi:HAD-IA family hydrolase [Kordiimonas pumila]|uniref:HAD-IA family hydrolase n=1 Tax=Kordiimonas pumila TaxID=2161677 RepID=A0ABV7D0L5_9PROT|nr:HAD-IA family hydrolase [Kordiimonas pumila]
MASYNKLVIFDCDGTLVDSQHLIVRSMQQTFMEAGLPTIADDTVRSIVGLSLQDAIAVLTPQESTTMHAALTEDYKRIYYRLRVELASGPDPLYDGTREALTALGEAGFLLGIATGNSIRGLERILKEHDLTDMFISLQTADGHPSKPHPSMIQKAIAEAGSAPEYTVMVGDTSYDMMMSARAGVAGLGVVWGYHSTDELLKAGARHIVNHYDEIPDIITGWIA